MSGLLIYLFPALMDMELFSVFFMSQVWVAQPEVGASPSTVANLITVWSVVYMLASIAIGRWVSKRNAARLIIAGCLGAAVLAAYYTGCAGVRGLYILMALQGVAMALFFTPFQVFMKMVGENKRRSINLSVGLYTMSWSLGAAAGPFAAGLLWETIGWKGCHVINGLTALLVGVGTWLLKHHAEAVHPPAPAADHDPNSAPAAADYSSMPDLAWMGWVFSGVGCIAVAVIRGLFPSSGAFFGIPKLEQGLVLFVFSAVQAVVGLSLSRGRWWMYRPLPILLFGLLGITSLGLFAVAGSPAGFFVAAACFGVYTGSLFFYLVFHSLVHPEKSAHYVSFNEAMVGLTGIAGPFLGGLVADRRGLPTAYLLAAGLLSLALAVQVPLHARLKKRW